MCLCVSGSARVARPWIGGVYVSVMPATAVGPWVTGTRVSMVSATGASVGV